MAYAIILSDFDPINVSFNVKVPSEAHPDGVALGNLDFLDKVDVVVIHVWVAWRGEDTTCCLLCFRRRRALKYD